MIKELTTDLSDLEDLKGIRIAVDKDRRPVLIFTYKEAPKARKGLAWVFWSVIAALYAAAGAAILWVLR